VQGLDAVFSHRWWLARLLDRLITRHIGVVTMLCHMPSRDDSIVVEMRYFLQVGFCFHTNTTHTHWRRLTYVSEQTSRDLSKAWEHNLLSERVWVVMTALAWLIYVCSPLIRVTATYDCVLATL
jgi:hypothetical protein